MEVAAYFTLASILFFLLIEMVFTRFRIGPDDPRDKHSRWIVLIIPFLCAAITASALTYYNDQGAFGWWSALGIALLVTGVAIRVIAKKQLGEHFTVAVTITKNQKLVRTGIYQYIRHPLYLGILLVYLSAPFIYGSIFPLFIFTIPSMLTIFWRCHVEEAALLAHFKKQWQDHVKSTWWIY